MNHIYQHTLLLACFLAIFQSTQQDQALQVKIRSKDDFCLVVPKDPFTRIGDSEYPGGEAVWCQSSSGKTSSSAGVFHGPFWTDVEVLRPKDGVVQMTGCINVNSCDRLRPDDDGGQYDSNGGDGGQGNPANSFCDPYHAYVQLIEPSAKRACIRCCKYSKDCDLSNDVRGCPVVIPGKYFSCA